MALTNEQYDAIMRKYSLKQQNARRIAEERLEEVARKCPEYVSIREEIARTAGAAFHSLSENGSISVEETVRKIASLSERKSAVLKEAGFPEDYAEPVYECTECNDTGFLPDGRKCSCFLKEQIDLLYRHSRLGRIPESENFDHLSYDYYQGEELEDFKRIVEICHSFADGFSDDPAKKQYENLLFYGNVGTGKSFLSACIAKELLDRGFSVIYFSAEELFRLLSDIMFRRDTETSLADTRSELYECDLIIIDDLGTELTNSAVALHLFSLLNERYLMRKSVIISTNMSLEELQQRYADRIFSRLIERYRFLKLTGPDIRRLKKA
ncbi:MAG: ATP-binding protein [Lachnospiraceae bacterium]|nr:ATP-binding protein [Lachnospiraceae bacterium]